MLNFKLKFKSETLNLFTNLNILLPDKPNGKLPVLYLLHGLTGDCDDWLNRANTYNICNEHNIAVVMPSANNSFYVNMHKGQRYFDYISTEIPNMVENIFPISKDPNKHYIAGLSMGGYGAMNIGLNLPKSFSAVASFSGVLDIAETMNIANDEDIKYNLGLCFENRIVPDKYNLFSLAENLSLEDKHRLKLYIACGTEDFLYNSNVKFYNSFKDKLNIKYVEEKADHEWWFWEKHLAEFLNMILGD